MQSFITSRNTRLSYSRLGQGDLLVCVPGGPLLSAEYLGDLGGLDRSAKLLLFNPPGSDIAVEHDEDAYRCDAVAEDLEALRLHLGLERLDLLGHSAGANIVLRYAERHPEHIGRLVLVSPSTRAVGIDISDEARSAVARSRAGESWYHEAAEALIRIQTGEALAEDWEAIAPFSYGRWNQASADYNAQMETSRNPAAAAAFGAEGAFNPPATRAILSTLQVPVTVIAGTADVGLPLGTLRELVALFPKAELAILTGAGHFPWIDDPEAFAAAARLALAKR